MDLELDAEWVVGQRHERRHGMLPEVDEEEEDAASLRDFQQLQADYASAVARAEQQERQAQALYELSQSVSVALELDDLRQSIVESLYEVLRADTTSLFLRQNDGNMRMVAQCNIDLTRARIVFGPDEGLVAQAAREHRVIYVPDTSMNALYLVTSHDHPRSMLAIPVDPQTGPSYVVCIVRRRLYAFTDDEIQFAQSMASVAAHALSNAALYNEMSALAREHTTLYELARASNISDGVTTFISHALEPLRGALDATGCAIMLLPDDVAFTPNRGHIASQGMSPQSLNQCQAFANELKEQNSLAEIAIRCDVAPDGSRLILAPVIAHDCAIAIIGWEILIPSLSDEESRAPLGVWSANQHLVSDIPSIVVRDSLKDPLKVPLTDVETTFIVSICQQMALGIENLHLRVRDLGAFRSISALPASRPHLDHVRQSIVAEVAKVFTPAAVALILRDETTNEARVVAATQKLNSGWIQTAIRLAPETRELRQYRGIVLTALVADGETIGWLALRLMSATHLSADRALVLTSLAGAAALLLRNARLHIMAREAAVDRERQRIAREIHDGVAQNLAHLMLRLELVQRLIPGDPDRAIGEAEGARQVLLTSLNDLRQSIAALAPAQLDELGFAGAVQSLLDDVATNNPDLHITFTGCPESSIPPELRAPAFRVVQEAISNIRKHARARKAWITIEIVKSDVLHVVIKDDGQGFQPDLDGHSNGHFGLRSMRDRATEFGGVLQIDSLPGEGTTVQLSLPLAMAA
jgi:signal transduction histidine kinase